MNINNTLNNKNRRNLNKIQNVLYTMLGGKNTNTNTDTDTDPPSHQSIVENIGTIKDSAGNIVEDVKNDVVNSVGDVKNDVVDVAGDVVDTAGNALKFVENPVKNIENSIEGLIHVPTVLEQIIVDPQFIQQVKIVSLTLAQALSDSIEIVTPYMLQSYSTVVEKLARVGALAILDAVGVIPGVGEVLDAILIVHNLIMAVMNVSRASVQITDISALLVSNLIRIYKQNAQKVKAAHGRITTSTNQFQNTNNPSTETTQSGGNKKNNKSKTKSRRIR